jgi:hypothetical protein
MKADRGSIWILVCTNVLVLAIAWAQKWPLFWLLIPYWVQNVVIGWYSAGRILALERFSMEGTSGFEGKDDAEIKRNTVAFFACHYGLFHFGYLFFMYIAISTGKLPGGMKVPEITGEDWLWIAGVSLSFALTHRASFKRNLENDKRGCPNIGVLMFLPYARVVPMHLTFVIGLGLGYSGAVLLFGALKTIADVGMHIVEHRVLAAPDSIRPSRR